MPPTAGAIRAYGHRPRGSPYRRRDGGPDVPGTARRLGLGGAVRSRMTDTARLLSTVWADGRVGGQEPEFMARVMSADALPASFAGSPPVSTAVM